MTSQPIELSFRSELRAPKDKVWDWITSFRGISRELWPIMKMTVPPGLTDLSSVQVEPGKMICQSWILLFGIIPVDRADLTLIKLDRGTGFVEQSPTLTMRLWRHERTLEDRGGLTIITDKITFQPKVVAPAVRWLMHKVFTHRHAVLRKHFG